MPTEEPEDLPISAIKVSDVTEITDRLLARSGKFRVFFSRAELEAHVVFAMAPHYQGLKSSVRIFDAPPTIQTDGKQ